MSKTIYHPYSPQSSPLVDTDRANRTITNSPSKLLTVGKQTLTSTTAVKPNSPMRTIANAPNGNITPWSSPNQYRTAYGDMTTGDAVGVNHNRIGHLTNNSTSPVGSASWTSQHQYRTSYAEMTVKEPIGLTTMANALEQPHVSDYARQIHSIGANKASQAGETFNPAVHGSYPAPAGHAHMRDTVAFASPVKLVDNRLSKNSGLDGFRENLVKYPPLQEGRDLDPKTFKPWTPAVTLKFKTGEQQFNHQDNSRASYGQFVPASSTLRAHAYRDFHKDTGLVTDGGQRTSCFEMPAGYNHYAAPYSQCWPIAPIPEATVALVEGRGAPHRIDH